ncbi:MAG: hypothetical protein AAFQ80_01320 [Cyanobacteria bacterium J06621_8]
MEVKGEDNLLLRLKAAPTADLSQLSAQYFTTYNELKALAEAESQKLIAEKDSRIQALETMLKTAVEQPRFYRNVTVREGNYNEEIEGDYSE